MSLSDAEKVTRLEAALVEAEQRLARVEELEVELREVTTRYDAALSVAVHERDEARALLERARRVHDDLVSSLSWRVTRPLRSLKK